MKNEYLFISWIEPLDCVELFKDDKNFCFLHSNDVKEYDDEVKEISRYSYLSASPFLTVEAKNNKIYIDDKEQKKDCPFEILQEIFNNYKVAHNEKLPPFQGGAIGYFSYDSFMYIEDFKNYKENKSSIKNKKSIDIPDIKLVFFDWVIAFDNKKKEVFIIKTSFSKKDIYKIKNKLNELRNAKSSNKLIKSKLTNDELKSNKSIIGKDSSNVSKEKYIKDVDKIIRLIYEGDVFQVNLSQEFVVNKKVKPIDVFLKLNNINPAPFSAYLEFKDFQIISSSPERFLKIDEKNFVETRPIKGTRKVTGNKEVDEKNKIDLIKSEKDNAENTMIVDLMRNDLSKTCYSNSIKVQKLCGLEKYASVFHLVSVVTGKVKECYNSIDVLKKSFPGGSITGAPKIRAMEIIDKLEKRKRGVYCGSIGYIGFSGVMDMNIAIRTITSKDGKFIYGSGGGVVYDSDSEEEYKETLVKTKSFFNVFGM